MTPVIPWSMTNIYLIPGATFTLNKNNQFTRCSLPRKPVKRTSCSQKLLLPVPSFATSFPRSGLLHRSIQLKVSATGTDVTVEEPDSPVLDESSVGASETQAGAGETTETSPAKSVASPASAQPRRARPARKSEMPPVKNEDLIPGAMFSGKVRSIQPFGAFVDFGAFTDGLVHVSRLTDGFVKDVGNVVSIGQEVQVRLIEANTETGRISLSMRESDDPAKVQQQDTPASASSDKPRPPRRNTGRSNQRREEGKSSKFVKGQELEGTVKNLTRSGAFISLPEGEEGFLPTSEEADDGIGSMLGSSSLEVGQEVSVRVLRLSRGKVTLTMKKEEDEAKLDAEFGTGVIHAATNPFVIAFRQNKDIAAFLDDREKVEEPKKKVSEEVGSQANQKEVVSDVPEVQEQPAGSDEESVGGSTEAAVASENVDSETTQSEEKEDDSSAVLDLEGSASAVGESIVETPSTDSAEKTDKSDLSAEIASEASSVESPTTEEIVESQPTAGDEISSAASVEKDDDGATSDENGSVIGSDFQEDSASPQEAKEEEEKVESTVASVDSTEASVLSSDSQAVEETAEKQVETIQDDAQIQTPAAETETTVSEKEAVEEVVTDQVEDIKEVQEQTPVAEAETTSSTDQAVEDVVTDQVEDIKEVQVQSPAAEAETTSSAEQAVEEVVESQVEDTKEEAQIQTPAAENPEKVENTTENATKATISPALVKQLREETGAGMMDCKKALSETGGDIVKAQEYLRKKGLASAEKKASRATAEGRIGSYIHDSRIGVLVEVNCETDFVSRGEIFKELVDDIAMQVAACPQVQYLVTEDVPEEIVNKEREIEMQKEDLASKPEQIREKIVEGRIRKRLEELALLEQPYIKNDKVVIKDWVKQTIATIGENIKVKRFVRFNLGEGLEKKSQDFAAEVAAQTAAKPAAAPAPVTEQPAAAEAKETEEKKPAVAVSAALVKQLREETGAGMMDCKKALSETGGDLEKAQEYLRKKGLSTADKKSSRLAAEGRIGAYIHDSRIGVLIEVNCETDFVGRSENFKELVNDLAMQVVACPQVQFVSIEDIPEEIVKKEKELEMQREDLASKPENIRERIVEGRVSKRLGELTLVEQPFIKNDSILVKDLVKQTVAALGENIKVRRFVRFTLGEATQGEEAETES